MIIMKVITVMILKIKNKDNARLSKKILSGKKGNHIKP